ncbi:MAG: protein-L-isoaspartate O-methyltransferase, partial [Geminicoccaceae bacterium]|nr:protein-L-isoaspartate O-methyltransferase [Geminicoccaceae bacterium]
AEPFAAARQRMVEMIERHAREAPDALGSEQIDPEVLAVMAELPRHEFVPDDQRDYAYDDRPLPIGYGQTISQPFIVALMTAMAEVGPDDVVLEVGTGSGYQAAVLEVGTGSGYQAAVLARLVDEVHTIEIVRGLAETAEERLARQGFANVETYQGDGYYGIEAAAPFDAIVVTAAASHVPPPLIAQLKPGGRMVIPVGGGFALQQLMLIEKDDLGRVHTRQTLPVAFVPLTRGS